MGNERGSIETSKTSNFVFTITLSLTTIPQNRQIGTRSHNVQIRKIRLRRVNNLFRMIQEINYKTTTIQSYLPQKPHFSPTEIVSSSPHSVKLSVSTDKFLINYCILSPVLTALHRLSVNSLNNHEVSTIYYHYFIENVAQESEVTCPR